MADEFVSPVYVDQFVKVLKPFGTHWFDIGVFLGASTEKLREIRKVYTSDGVVTCLAELHDCLAKKGNLTWESIATVLKELDNNALADSIHSNYILPAIHRASTNEDRTTSTGSTTVQPVPMEIPTSDTDSQVVDSSNEDSTTNTAVPEQHQVPMVTPTSASQVVTIKDKLIDEVGEEFQSLSDRFDYLTIKIRRSFVAAAASNVIIEEMQHVVAAKCGLSPLPENEATVGTIFNTLLKKCSILNFRPLMFAVNTLLSNEETLQMELGNLKASVDSFNRSSKMIDLAAFIKSHQPSEGNDDHKTVKLKLRDFWIKFTMEQFEIMMNAILDTLYDQLSHITVSTGCICVNWIIPPSVDYTKLLPKLSLEFLQIIGVISLHIGDDVIYNVGEEGCQTLKAAMLQAIELKNTGAIELLLAVGCSPEVATYNGDHAVTNVVNIRERSVDDGSGGGVDHVCVLGHNEHIEAIIDPSREPECATCRIKEKQIKQLHMKFERKDHDHVEIQELTNKLNEKEKLADTLQMKNKDLCLEIETLSSEYDASYQAKKDAEIEELTEQLKEKEKLADTLQMKNKNLCLEIETLSSEYDASYQAKKDAEIEEVTEHLNEKEELADALRFKNETLSSEYDAYQASKDAEIEELTEQLKEKEELAHTLQSKNDTLSSEYDTYQAKKGAEIEQLKEKIAESASLDSALTESTKDALMRENEKLRKDLKLKTDRSRSISEKKKDVPIPSVNQFAKELSKEPDWYTLGTFLDAPTGDLDSIKHECRGMRITRCLIEVHKCLERLGKVPSWNSIAEELKALDNHALAEHIDSTYIHPSTEPPSEFSSSNSEQSGAGIPDSVDQTSRAPEVRVPPEVSKEYSLLSIELTKLYLCYKNAFKASNQDIEDVQHVIERHGSLKPYPGNEATWKDLFLRLDQESSMFEDPHILTVLNDTVSFVNPELSDQTGKFNETVDIFIKSAEMRELITLFKKSEQTHCQIVVQERWNHKTLAGFEAEMRKLVGSLIENQSFCLAISHPNHDEHVINSINSESECPCTQREEPGKQCAEPVQRTIEKLDVKNDPEILDLKLTEQLGAESMTSTTQLKSKAVTPKEVFDILKPESTEWSSIGRALEVPLKHSQEIVQKGSTMSADDKLKLMIQMWIKSECSPVNWKKIRDVLKYLKFNYLLERVPDED